MHSIFFKIKLIVVLFLPSQERKTKRKEERRRKKDLKSLLFEKTLHQQRNRQTGCCSSSMWTSDFWGMTFLSSVESGYKELKKTTQRINGAVTPKTGEITD